MSHLISQPITVRRVDKQLGFGHTLIVQSSGWNEFGSSQYQVLFQPIGRTALAEVHI